MIIAGIDLETTGLDANNDVVTEVGVVLWDTEKNRPVKFFNELIAINCAISQENENITGISNELLARFGEDASKVWRKFEEFCEPADYLLAHNAPFDKSFVVKQVPEMSKMVWIDSCTDVEYPENIQTRKLTHLAAEHGFVNPFSHRALTDVLTMLQLVSNYDWNEVVSNAVEPKAIMRAMVTVPEKDKAKNVGYRFNQQTKFWTKQVRESKVNEETLKCNKLGFFSKRIG